MKFNKAAKNLLTIGSVLFLSSVAVAETAENEEKTEPKTEVIVKGMDSLGGNMELYNKARALSPTTKFKVVQSRIVPRKNRHEVYTEFANTVGGNALLNTQALSLNYQYHLNPKLSFGVRYSHHTNRLTEEGKSYVNSGLSLIEESLNNGLAVNPNFIPEVDAPKNSVMATVNWYPFYGKFNFFDRSVVHFDFYLSGGYGQMALFSGSSDTFSAGGGIGFWLSKNLTGRLEARWQSYEVLWFSSRTQSLNTTNIGFSVGYLL